MSLDPLSSSASASKKSLTIENIIGPVLATQNIPETCVQPILNHFIEFFVPIKMVYDAFSAIKSHSLVGTNVYAIGSSLPAIVLHQGIVEYVVNGEDIFMKSAMKVLKTYNKTWHLESITSTYVISPPDQPVLGVRLLVYITDDLPKFESSVQFEIKSKSFNRGPSKGIAVVYGEPMFEIPRTFDMEELEFLPMIPKEQIIMANNRWMMFGQSGEPILPYVQSEFVDEDIPFDQWIATRFKTHSLYIDVGTQRFELSGKGNKMRFRFCLLYPYAPSLSTIAIDGSPVRDMYREVLNDDIVWNEVVWNPHSITVCNKEYGPIDGVFWAKRKKPR